MLSLFDISDKSSMIEGAHPPKCTSTWRIVAASAQLLFGIDQSAGKLAPAFEWGIHRFRTTTRQIGARSSPQSFNSSPQCFGELLAIHVSSATAGL
jgi:hypothetical protein